MLRKRARCYKGFFLQGPRVQLFAPLTAACLLLLQNWTLLVRARWSWLVVLSAGERIRRQLHRRSACAVLRHLAWQRRFRWLRVSPDVLRALHAFVALPEHR